MNCLPAAALALGLCLVWPALAASGEATTDAVASRQQAQQLARRLDSESARSVVQSYGDRFEDDVLSHLDHAEPEWIALAPRLAGGTDAATSEGLSIALAYALPLQPAAVLTVLSTNDGPLSAQRVCSTPFIEDSVKDIKAYQAHAIQAVGQVRDPALQEARTHCLLALRS